MHDNIYYNEGHAFHRSFLFQLIFHTVIFIHLLFVINFSVTSRSHANQWAKLFQYFRLDRFPTKKEKKKKKRIRRLSASITKGARLWANNVTKKADCKDNVGSTQGTLWTLQTNDATEYTCDFKAPSRRTCYQLRVLLNGKTDFQNWQNTE